MLWFLGGNVEVNGRFRYIYKRSEIYLWERYVKTVLLSVAVSTVTPMLASHLVRRLDFEREREREDSDPQFCYTERLKNEVQVWLMDGRRISDNWAECCKVYEYQCE